MVRGDGTGDDRAHRHGLRRPRPVVGRHARRRHGALAARGPVRRRGRAWCHGGGDRGPFGGAALRRPHGLCGRRLLRASSPSSTGWNCPAPSGSAAGAPAADPGRRARRAPGPGGRGRGRCRGRRGGRRRRRARRGRRAGGAVGQRHRHPSRSRPKRRRPSAAPSRSGIACVAGSPLLAASRHPIAIPTPPEVLAGSTRLAAGTAQKCALNILSTGVALRLGHAYRGLMVNMVPDNAKLKRRAVSIVARAAGIAPERAEAALEAAGWSIKVAVTLARRRRRCRRGARSPDAPRRRYPGGAADVTSRRGPGSETRHGCAAMEEDAMGIESRDILGAGRRHARGGGASRHGPPTPR